MMSRAADFRKGARNSLSGYWGMPLLVCLLAGIMGAGYSSGGGVSVSAGSDSNEWSEVFGRLFHSGINLQRDELTQALLIAWATFSVIFALIGIALVFVGGATRLGVCSYFCRLTLGERPPFSTMFQGFRIFWKGAGLYWFMALFIMLWSLLFVIPGIIASYRYALATYIMAENHDMGIREAVDRSKGLMAGNKWRLFCLELSFLGWHLLSVLTLGILQLWIAPYMETSHAAFYLELTGRPYGFSTYHGPTPNNHTPPGPDQGYRSDREMI